MAVEEAAEGEEVNDPPKTDQQKTKLSHKKWRRLLQKEKRRVKRQQLAEKRKQLDEQEKWRLENDSLYRARQEARERAEEKRRLQEEEESKKQEKLWLEREAQAQIAFRKIKEKEEKKERERIDQERRIKEEWEEEQRLKQEKEEKKKKEIQEKENAVFKELEKPAEQTSKDNQWHNPLAPASLSQKNYGTEQDNVNCSFYLKTGACRFGERCSRVHPRLPSSVTLLIPHMYQDIRLSQTMLDEADHDTGLEYDDEEANERYKNFFEDVLPEFEKAGKVVQFKVCCNHEPHLRGNVYVQFSSEEECTQAFAAFNGRWYAGKQLSCEYSPVTKWRSAICGFFTRNRCPRGKNCNFLHVYRNPGNAFRSMDRDGSSPGQPPYTERGSERSMRDWRRDSRDRESSIRERSSDRDYERNREYRYSRERERYRDRDHERRHYRESHECRSSKRRDRDNGHDSDEEHSRRHNENHKDSPQRSRQDRFGRDVDRSISKRQETNGNNSNKRNSSDKDNDDVVLHQEHHKRKISHNDRDLSPDGSNGGSHSDHSHSDQEDGKRITSSDVEVDASNMKRRHHKRKHTHKHKKSKKKHKHKHKRKSSDSDE